MTIKQRHMCFAVCCLALIFFDFGSLRRVVALSLAVSNTDSSHILLIPCITAALLFSKRKSILKDPGTSRLPALLAFALALAFHYAGSVYGSQLTEADYLAIRTSAMIAFGFGAIFLFYGAGAFKAALFPLLFLLLAIPIPSRVFHETARLLQHGSAWMVSILFTLSATPAYRHDVMFMLPGLTIEVGEDCSGIRSTFGIFIVTLLASHLLLKSNWRRVALLVAAIPISLFKNAVRIAALSILAIRWDMGFITGRLHHEGGIVFMMIGLALLYPVLALLVRSEAKGFATGVRS